MDADGNVVARHQSERNAAGFAATAKDAYAFIELTAKAEGGDEKAALEVFEKKLGLGRYQSSADARAAMEQLSGATDAQKTKWEGALFDLEIQAKLRSIGRDQAALAVAGEEFFEQHEAGKQPQSQRIAQGFYLGIIAHGRETKNAEAFEAGVNKLEELFGKNAGARKTLDGLKKELEELNK